MLNLEQEITSLRARAREHKSEIRRHRRELRECAALIAEYEEALRRRGIKLISTREGEKHGAGKEPSD